MALQQILIYGPIYQNIVYIEMESWIERLMMLHPIGLVSVYMCAWPLDDFAYFN